jgi:hypothetical protein
MIFVLFLDNIVKYLVNVEQCPLVMMGHFMGCAMNNIIHNYTMFMFNYNLNTQTCEVVHVV